VRRSAYGAGGRLSMRAREAGGGHGNGEQGLEITPPQAAGA
jgi:hypothetical protein